MFDTVVRDKAQIVAATSINESLMALFLFLKYLKYNSITIRGTCIIRTCLEAVLSATKNDIGIIAINKIFEIRL